MDLDKAAGNFTGLTISQGHPQGPEAALAAQVEDRLALSKKYVLEVVKHDIKVGDYDKASERLTKIGLTPKESNALIRRIENPKDGMTATQRRNFNRHANESDRAAMDAVE